jgi:hypothetical protein
MGFSSGGVHVIRARADGVAVGPDLRREQPLQGYVDYVGFTGPTTPLRPQVGMRVFFNPPVIDYPEVFVDEIGPYSARLFAFADPHFNAGTIRAEVRPIGGSFRVVDEAPHDGSLFQLDVDTLAEDLDADTEHEFRFSYTVTRNGAVATGSTRTFRTRPPPRFAFSSSVTGAGAIVTDPAPEADGTFIDRTTVTIRAVADDGHEVDRFVVDGRRVTGSSTTVTVAGPLAVEASFVALPPPPPVGPGDDTDPVPPGDDGDDGTAPPPDDEAVGPDSGGSGNGDDDDDDDSNDSEGGDRAGRQRGDRTDVSNGSCAAAPTSTPVMVVLFALRRRRRR